MSLVHWCLSSPGICRPLCLPFPGFYCPIKAYVLSYLQCPRVYPTLVSSVPWCLLFPGFYCPIKSYVPSYLQCPRVYPTLVSSVPRVSIVAGCLPSPGVYCPFLAIVFCALMSTIHSCLLSPGVAVHHVCRAIASVVSWCISIICW